MEFHQTYHERFAEKIILHLSKQFDGKTMNSDDMTIELMVKSLPYYKDDDIVDMSPTVPETVIKTIPVPKDNEDNEEVSCPNNDHDEQVSSPEYEPEPEQSNNNNNHEPTPVINNDSDEELFTDNIVDIPVKKGKKKNNKQTDIPDNVEKVKRKPNAYINWKIHPDNAEAINIKADEINEETGKRYGKTKAAGFLWKLLSKEEQIKWVKS